MDDLVQWLGEQLDEDFEAVRLVLGVNVMAAYRRGEPVPRWVPSPEGDAGIWDTTGAPRVKFVWARERDHIIRHDPARVLREIDAKRQLVVRGGPFCTSNCDDPGNEPKNPDTNWTTPLVHHFDCAAYEAAKVLAVPYDQRPGYREGWRP